MVRPATSLADTLIARLQADCTAAEAAERAVRASVEAQLKDAERMRAFAWRRLSALGDMARIAALEPDRELAIERQLVPRHRSPNPYVWLIKGVDDFAAGRAKRISGLRTEGAHILHITLDRPAGDFPSILTLPFFSPVPEEYASDYEPGESYGRHLIASGPYRLKRYTPGRVIELVRNENWDPRTDPLRSAWVDKVSVTIGRSWLIDHACT